MHTRNQRYPRRNSGDPAEPRADQQLLKSAEDKPKRGLKRQLPEPNDGSNEQEVANHDVNPSPAGDQQVVPQPQQEPLPSRQTTQEACCLVDGDDITREEEAADEMDVEEAELGQTAEDPSSEPLDRSTSPRQAPSFESGVQIAADGKQPSNEAQADKHHSRLPTPSLPTGSSCTESEGPSEGNERKKQRIVLDSRAANQRGPEATTAQNKKDNNGSGGNGGSNSGQGQDRPRSGSGSAPTDDDNSNPREGSGGDGSGSGEGEGSNMPPTTKKHTTTAHQHNEDGGGKKRQRRRKAGGVGRGHSQSQTSQLDSVAGAATQQQREADDGGTRHKRLKSVTAQSPRAHADVGYAASNQRKEGPRPALPDAAKNTRPIHQQQHKHQHAIARPADIEKTTKITTTAAAVPSVAPLVGAPHPWLPIVDGSNASSGTVANSASLQRSKASLQEAENYYTKAQHEFMNQLCSIMQYVQEQPQISQQADVAAIHRACSTATAIINFFAPPTTMSGIGVPPGPQLPTGMLGVAPHQHQNVVPAATVPGPEHLAVAPPQNTNNSSMPTLSSLMMPPPPPPQQAPMPTFTGMYPLATVATGIGSGTLGNTIGAGLGSHMKNPIPPSITTGPPRFNQMGAYSFGAAPPPHHLPAGSSDAAVNALKHHDMLYPLKPPAAMVPVSGSGAGAMGLMPSATMMMPPPLFPPSLMQQQQQQIHEQQQQRQQEQGDHPQ